MKRLLATLVALSFCGVCRAQFAGPSFFNTLPVSGIGTVTSNTLVLTDTATGFFVTGQVVITLPAAPVSGLLVAWDVMRPLDPTYGTGTFTTTTVLSGFSLPPAGTFNNSLGLVDTRWTNPGAITVSTVPMALVNGIDSPAWVSLSATSPSFGYTSAAGHFMIQRFSLNGDYVTGGGGNWTIDVPVFSFVTPVPEPTLILLPALGIGAVWLQRRWVRFPR